MSPIQNPYPAIGDPLFICLSPDEIIIAKKLGCDAVRIWDNSAAYHFIVEGLKDYHVAPVRRSPIRMAAWAWRKRQIDVIKAAAKDERWASRPRARHPHKKASRSASTGLTR